MNYNLRRFYEGLSSNFPDRYRVQHNSTEFGEAFKVSLNIYLTQVESTETIEFFTHPEITGELVGKIMKHDFIQELKKLIEELEEDRK